MIATQGKQLLSAKGCDMISEGGGPQVLKTFDFAECVSHASSSIKSQAA
jgi:hypothetical protein